MPASPRDAECVPIDIADHPAVIDFCKANEVDFVVVGPDAAVAAGVVDDLNAAGLQGVRADQGRGPARELEEFHQAALPRQQHSDRGLWALQGCRGGKGLHPQAGRADRGEG